MTIQFRAERDTLLDTLSTAARAVSKRGGMLPVLSGVRLQITNGRLAATGSDLDHTIVASCDVQVGSAGDFVMPGDLGVGVIRALEPGVVTVTVDADTATVEGGRTKYDLRVRPAAEYPNLVLPDQSNPITVPGDQFAAALRQVLPAVSTDDNRPIITGVLTAVENGAVRLAATDSYRLAVKDVPGLTVMPDDTARLVPGRAYNDLVRLIGKSDRKVHVAVGERDMSFTTDGTILVTRLIEGEFPNYKALMPSGYPNQLTVGRENFATVLGRVRLLARDSAPIRLHMETGKVTVTAKAQDVGDAVEEMDCTYVGDELTIAFNPEYLQQGLECCVGDEVVLSTIDALKPATVASTTDGEFTYLIMPVRVS